MHAGICLLLLSTWLPGGWLADQEALENYVNTPDPNYNYTLKKTEEKTDVTLYTLNMTSLKWLNESLVDRPIWWHDLYIVVPKIAQRTDSCLLIIDGGNNDAPLIDFSNTNVAVAINIARATKMCTAVVRQIANQPLTYLTIPSPLCQNSTETPELFCSWWLYMNDISLKQEVLIQFPMVKASVRAMDTVADFVQKISNGQMIITKFSVTGASKRGWAAWLVAAADQRAKSLMPIVFDLLKIIPNLHRQYRAFCGWSTELSSFRDLNLSRQLDTERMKNLTYYVDPFTYNEKYANKPKLLITASGDEIFPVDDTSIYFGDLAGEKHLRVVPNIEHLTLSTLIINPSVQTSLASYFATTMQNTARPQVSWSKVETNSSGIIYLKADQTPFPVTCYFATTLNGKRDFRLITGTPPYLDPVLWTTCPVVYLGNGIYKAEVLKHPTQWRAFFIEATFLGFQTFIFTSEAFVIPDTFPCPDCVGEQCYGTIV